MLPSPLDACSPGPLRSATVEHGRATAGGRAKRSRGLGRRALVIALTYIDEHVGERFSLEDLATAAAVSRFHFARLFRISTGASPMAFLLRVRIQRARQLLRHGEPNIASVAAALGFFDQSHFARSFRRLSGMSPSAFVQLARESVPTAQSGTLRASRIGPTTQTAAPTAPVARTGARCTRAAFAVSGHHAGSGGPARR